MRDYNINLQDNYVDLQHNYVENQANCNQITIIQNLKNIYIYISPTCDFQNARCYFFLSGHGKWWICWHDTKLFYVDMQFIFFTTCNWFILSCNVFMSTSKLVMLTCKINILTAT